jgi:hypothetical protein
MPVTTIVNRSDWWTKLWMRSDMSMGYSIQKGTRQFATNQKWGVEGKECVLNRMKKSLQIVF